MKTILLLFISGYFILSGYSDTQHKVEHIRQTKQFDNGNKADFSPFIANYTKKTILFVIDPPVCEYCMNDIYT